MILLLSFWALYFFLHSLFAANAVKQKLQSILGISRQSYRLTYNFLNLLGLLAAIWFHISVECPSFYNITVTVRIAVTSLTLAGFALMIQSAREYHLSSFLGLSKEPNMPLQVSGLHKYMRHPLYSGTLLFFTGICIAFPFYKNWYLLLLLTVYLFIGMWLEEQKLIVLFGDAYRLYKQKVKRLIPGVL